MSYHHSDETRRKISESNKGKKRKPESPEAKKRRVAAMLASPNRYYPTPEHKEKLRQRMKTRIVSDATKAKLRVHNLGKKLPKEVKDKIRRSMIGKISGDKNPSWMGGVNPLILSIRSSYKSRQWRSDIFYRDDFTCQVCFGRGGKLHADHIRAFSAIFYANTIKSLQEALDCEEFWDLNNGRTLCYDCHRKTDTYGKNTRFQR